LARHFTNAQATKVKLIIRRILLYGEWREDEKDKPRDDISLIVPLGNREGVDSWAVDIANQLGIPTTTYHYIPQWENKVTDKGTEMGFYDVANKIVDECDAFWVFEPEGDEQRPVEKVPESFMFSGGEYIFRKVQKLEKKAEHWRVRAF